MHYFTANEKIIIISVSFLKFTLSYKKWQILWYWVYTVRWEGQGNMKEDGNVRTSKFVLPTKGSRNGDAWKLNYYWQTSYPEQRHKMFFYHTCIKFRGLIFCVFDWKKICGILIFVAKAAWSVQSLLDLPSMLVIVD